MWNFESGFIINIDSGKCVQIGGSLDEQCTGMELKNKATLQEASEYLLRASSSKKAHEWRHDVQHKHPYISASAAPAVLFPCNRGCSPDDMQRWEAVLLKRTTTTTDNTNTNPNVVGQVVMLKLRTNLDLCLRSGVDSQHVSSWVQSAEPWIALLVLSLPMLWAFYHERKYRKYRKLHYKLYLFGESFGVGVLVLRLLCSASTLAQVFFWKAVTLSNANGGRGFWPRQYVVHGTLFGANLLFIHVMLVSRMKTIEERKDLHEKKMKIWESWRRREESHSVHHTGYHHNSHHSSNKHGHSKSSSLGSSREKGTEMKVVRSNAANEEVSSDHTNRSNHTNRSISTSSVTSSAAVSAIFCWSILQMTYIRAKFMSRKYIIERPTVFVNFLYLILFRMLSFYEIDFRNMSSIMAATKKPGAQVDEETTSSMDGNILLWVIAGGILYPSFMQIGSSIAEVRAEERSISDAKRQAPRAKEIAVAESDVSTPNPNDSDASSDGSNSGSSNSNDSRRSKSLRSRQGRQRDTAYSDDGGSERSGHGGAASVVVGNSVGGGLIARHLLKSYYTARFMQRWTAIVLFQLFIFISGFFSPSGPPNYFPTVAVDVLVLSLVMESLLGTIKQRSFSAWASKYHVVGALTFCIPLIFVCMWEFVGMVVGSFRDTGQIHMQNSGNVGSPLLLRGTHSNGWWWGNNQNYVLFMSSFCWLGICASLNLLPSFIRWIGIRGPKAPLWLEDLLIETDGHVPRLANGNKYREFASTRSILR